MEGFAAITDFHGNLPAHQAALARVEEIDPDRVYCGGDLAGKPKDDPRGALSVLEAVSEKATR